MSPNPRFPIIEITVRRWKLMFEYKFVKINVDYKPFATNQKTVEDYHEVIEENAKDGWRLVQIFAPPVKGYGLADYFELIFEREK
jgi:hypothetical protein